MTMELRKSTQLATLFQSDTKAMIKGISYGNYFLSISADLQWNKVDWPSPVVGWTEATN